jgi:salicylate hydroxylase
MSNNQIIVAGGGIGGLGAALGLAQKGFDVVVLEKASEFGEIGAGIQIGPNAFHAFDYLGVGDEARAEAVYIDMLRMMDAVTGEEVAHIPLGDDFRKRFGNPYAVVHRADLHGVLFNGCRGIDKIDLRVNSEVTGYEQDGSSITAKLANGETVTGVALIGADGLRSNVRAQIVGDGEPRVSGHSTYRSVIPAEQMPEELRWNAATLWGGPKCHIVHYPLSGWKVFNLVITKDNNATDPVAGKPVTKDEVREQFMHIHELPRSLIDHGNDWKVWVLCDREPVDNWVDGRAVLLGDAAHPTLQYYAQGACMALEDAVCLSHMMEAYGGDHEKAFEDYRRQRVIRTARIQIGSRALGEHIYHPEGVHAQLRNAIMRSMTADDYYDRLQWLYGSTGLEPAVV